MDEEEEEDVDEEVEEKEEDGLVHLTRTKKISVLQQQNQEVGGITFICRRAHLSCNVLTLTFLRVFLLFLASFHRKEK